MNDTAVANYDETSAAPARCKNCDAPLFGAYCANCSQAADVHVPTTAELVHELMEGLTHSDSRLWRTLNYLWFKPGKLTQEFVAGRRVAYLPPFRLYLVVSVIFFLIASFAHPHTKVVHINNVADSAAANISACEQSDFDIYPAWNERFRHACKEVVNDNAANLMHVAMGMMSKAMFVLLPLIAFLHMLMYWHPRFRYAEHLLFFVHLHAFYFSLGILALGPIIAAYSWPILQGAADGLQTLLGWLGAIYTLIAVRRVFARSWTGAVFKTLTLSVVYLGAFALTVAAVFVYALLQL